jgi:hypothetical protein
LIDAQVRNGSEEEFHPVVLKIIMLRSAKKPIQALLNDILRLILILQQRTSVHYGARAYISYPGLKATFIRIAQHRSRPDGKIS